MQARVIQIPQLNIAAKAVELLYGKTDEAPFAANLRYELDGALLDRISAVDIKYYHSSKSVRINRHKSYDILEGKILLGWKRNADGDLVAVLKTPEAVEQVSGNLAKGHQQH